jgi:hypothetical protein
MFVEGIGKRGQPFFRRQVLVNVEKVENQRLMDVEIAGQLLPEIHGALLRLALPFEQMKLVDGSGWFGQYPNGAKDYYVDLFSSLTGDLMLVEDFVTDFAEAHFYANVVSPAFEAACSIIGKRPLVRRLCDNRRVISPLWNAYPASYRAHFNALGCEL